MGKYDVHFNQRCIENTESDEDYGEWYREYSNELSGVSTSEKKFPDVESTHDFKSGDKVYIVWIEYSTGNSFGRSSRGEVEAVGLFKDRSTAKELAKAIERHDTSSPNSFEERNRFTFEASDGQKFEYGFAPWTGYFERLEEVHVELIEIE